MDIRAIQQRLEHALNSSDAQMSFDLLQKLRSRCRSVQIFLETKQVDAEEQDKSQESLDAEREAGSFYEEEDEGAPAVPFSPPKSSQLSFEAEVSSLFSSSSKRQLTGKQAAVDSYRSSLSSRRETEIEFRFD